MLLRDTTPADFPTILRLNAESVHWLSPLTPERLEELHQTACYHKVACQEDQVLGFLLAFREGSSYSSPNYRWFSERYPRFCYIDRIVLHEAARGQGVGRQLYGDLSTLARTEAVPCLACEYDLEPLNPGSQAFHQRLGFQEIGRQQVYGKQVSLQLKTLNAGEQEWT
jgi:predicted GNAT superfamily acetyltransferase